MKDLMKVSIQNGKYIVVQRSSGALEVLRHHQHWRTETGDNLLLSLAQEVETLREVLHKIQKEHLLDRREDSFEGIDFLISEVLKEHED